ncbi:MAG: hypothetical protein M3P42_03270, partial [Actinomycetota bacterium]|nr:hypothetical protein [Actinomycetota bacterium]
MPTCAQCGASVDEPEAASAEQRVPCPECGSLRRLHDGASTLPVQFNGSTSGSVDRALNDTRLGVLALIVGIGLGSASLAAPAGWE